MPDTADSADPAIKAPPVQPAVTVERAGLPSVGVDPPRSEGDKPGFNKTEYMKRYMVEWRKRKKAKPHKGVHDEVD